MTSVFISDALRMASWLLIRMPLDRIVFAAMHCGRVRQSAIAPGQAMIKIPEATARTSETGAPRK